MEGLPPLAYYGVMIKRHYNYVIVGCCFLFLFVNLGMASTGFSVHQPYIVAMEGIGDTGGSLILSMRTFTSFVAMFVVDRYFNLLDVRRGIFVATALTATGFLIYSTASTLPTFLLGAVFLGFGYGFGGMVAVTYIASRWFTGGLGSMVGFASMGSGAATIVMPLILARVIEASSLSVAFRLEAAITIAVAFLMLLILRNRPQDIGLEPFEGHSGKKRRLSTMAPAPPWEHRILMAAMTGVGIFSCCGVTYIAVLATSNGFDAMFAASLVSIAGVALTIAKFVTGELFDRLGVAPGTAIMFSLGMAGYLLCCFSSYGIAALMVLAAILTGTGISLGSVGISVWSIDLSNPENRNREIRNFQLAYTLGAFLANSLPGLIKDGLGSYETSYGAILGITAIAAFIILRYYRRYRIRRS